jgi:large subunit ribosomal protein L21
MNKKYAVIRAQGKQMTVSEGETFDIDQIEGDAGTSVTFEEVLLVSDEGVSKVGTPTLSSAKVTAKIVKQFRGKKLIAYRKNITHGFTKKIGHRQYRTQLVVESIAA